VFFFKFEIKALSFPEAPELYTCQSVPKKFA
jgi:hypothetical protein